MMPLVSIITPAFNAEKYIYECAESILNQTYTNFEWIIINDGSTDNTLKSLEKIASNDERIKIYSQKNQGAAVARNFALDKRQGEYFIFLDADDLWDPFLLETCIESIAKTNADLVSFKFEDVPGDYNPFIDAPKQSKPHYKITTLHNIEGRIANSRHIKWNLWNKLYKTEPFQDIRFPKGMRQAEDVAFAWQVRAAVKTYININCLFYYYRDSTTSICRQGMTKHFLEGEYLLAKFLHKHFIMSDNTHAKDKILIKRWIAKKCFRYFMQKSYKIEDSQTKSLMRQYLEDLTSLGIFKTEFLPLRKKFSYYFLQFKKRLQYKYLA